MWLERDNNYRGRYIYPTPRKHYHSPTDRTILDTALRYLIRVMTEVDFPHGRAQDQPQGWPYDHPCGWLHEQPPEKEQDHHFPGQFCTFAMFSQFPFHFNNCLNIKQSGLSTWSPESSVCPVSWGCPLCQLNILGFFISKMFLFAPK